MSGGSDYVLGYRFWTVRSLSWTELIGDRLLRFVYLDETGISANEQVLVVAGVVVDADRQWRHLENYMHSLVLEYVPEESREGFFFHAKDLFHGSGKIFDRRKYSLDRSRDCLKKLIAIPGLFALPVVYGFQRKAAIPEENPPKSEQGKAIMGQVMAYSLCSIGVERFMRETASANEVATMVAENKTDVVRAIKAIHQLLSTPKALTVLPDFLHEFLPLGRIVDTVHFAGKKESILLQIADACALIIRYYLERKSRVEEFFDLLSKNNRAAIGDLDDAAGYRTLYFYNKSKVATGQSWLVSRNGRSTS